MLINSSVNNKIVFLSGCALSFGKRKGFMHKLTANGNVKIITTDGLQGYPRVLRKVFGLNR